MTLLLAHDAKDNGRYLDAIDPANAWLRAHGLDPNEIYRIEIHVIDTRLIRVFEYLREATGHLYCPLDHVHQWDHPDGCEIARGEPYDVLLRFDPPAELLAAHPTKETRS